MDCLEGLKQLDDNSIDAIVTDPPYGLEFMGKEWDKFEPKRLTQRWAGTERKLIGDGSGKGGDFGERFNEMPQSIPKKNKRCKKCGHYFFSGTPCKCETPEWELDNQYVNAFQDFCYTWAVEALRVLKPGGHLLSFGGSRTYHRMACGIEDAGFEIRDQIMWVYGSGFPKSLDIGKVIDKRKIGIEKIEEFAKFIREKRESMNISKTQADDYICGGSTMYSFFEGRKDKPLYFPNSEHYKKMKELFNLDSIWDTFVLETNEKIISTKEGSFGYQKNVERWTKEQKITEPNSPEAKEWEGWGTALKPAHEPIVLTRKPLSERTVAENVLKWGTGGLNIDECRIGMHERTYGLKGGENLNKLSRPNGNDSEVAKGCGAYGQGAKQITIGEKTVQGRFPANFIHDGSPEVTELFPNNNSPKTYIRSTEAHGNIDWNPKMKDTEQFGFGDSGSAARFFYCAKASKEERDMGCEGIIEKEMPYGSSGGGMPSGNDNPKKTFMRNNHPTVKPIVLMEYLVKLITKEKQLVLDPFIGSGTTALSCMITNRNFIGFEISKEYCDIAQRRMQSPTIKDEIQENKIKQISIDKWL